MADALPFPWDTLLELQSATDTGFIGAQTHAREEALTEIVDSLCTDTGPSDAESMLRRYWALTANRAKKYRHRAALTDQLGVLQRTKRQQPDQASLVALREILMLTLRGLARADRELLYAVRDGMTYSEIALKLGRPEGTVKSQLSRLRRHLRDGPDCRAVQMAPAA